MTDWLISLEGTESGHQLALALALLAAFLHAVFGALQKGRHDPWLTRGAVDICYSAIAAPFAFFVVPWPEPHMWVIFAAAFVIHFGYKLSQAFAYTKGDYTVVYPVVRGTGPLFTVIGAYWLFGETFTGTQWLGVAVLLAGIFGLAIYNMIFLASNRDTLNAALLLALLTGGPRTRPRCCRTSGWSVACRRTYGWARRLRIRRKPKSACRICCRSRHRCISCPVSRCWDRST